MTLKSLLKDWTLPLSMVVGTISYVALTQIAALHDTKVALQATVPYLLPSLIFVMLLFSYGNYIHHYLKYFYRHFSSSRISFGGTRNGHDLL